MKRILSIILTLSLCLTLLPLLPLLPSQAVYIGDLRYTISNGEATITGCNTSASGNLVIPATIDGYPVTGIGDSAFYNCTRLLSITLPDGLTSIGDSAFFGCTNLSSITLPDSITSIGAEAFKNCSLREIILPDGLTSIGESAFAYCTGLGSITLSDGLTSIEKSAFAYCTSLSSITLPNGLTSIEEDAFSYCTSLGSITLPNSLTSIGERAFYYCTGLGSITIPDGITSIERCTFDGCTSLSSITLPDSITSIGGSAFADCNSLVYNTYAEGKYLGNRENPYVALMDTTGTDFSSFTIHSNTKVIGYSAFEHCRSLSSITVPDSVTTIGYCAFDGCTSLSSITLPAGITSIEYRTFDGCTSLHQIYFAGNAPEIASDAFGKVNATVSYHTGTEGWTDDVKQHYGGSITWTEADHIYGKYISDNNYTCTADGTKRAVCMTCGQGVDVQLDVGSARHRMQYTSNNDATCTLDGTKTGTCLLCGQTELVLDIGSATGHSFTNYISNDNYSCTVDGTKTAKCDHCEQMDTQIDWGSASHRYVNGVCIFCGDVTEISAVLTGTLTTWGDGETVLTLLFDGASVCTLTVSDGTYTMEQLTVGDCVLRVTKDGCVTREYQLTLTEGENLLDVELFRNGDINGDGKLNMGDISRIYAHIKKTTLLTEVYQLLCADFDGNGKLNVGDVSRAYAQVKGGRQV